MRRQSARGGEGLEGGGAEGRGQREGGPFGGRPGPSLRKGGRAGLLASLVPQEPTSITC